MLGGCCGVVGMELMVVTDTGDYIAHRIKFYACPNEGQQIFGGGEYTVFSNSVPNPHLCIPIYLGVNGSNGIHTLSDVYSLKWAHLQDTITPPLKWEENNKAIMEELLSRIRV